MFLGLWRVLVCRTSFGEPPPQLNLVVIGNLSPATERQFDLMSKSKDDHGKFPWLDVLADALNPAKIVNIDALREWSLSQVIRLTLDDDRTLIAKRGIPTKGPTELEIYQECLIPLEIDAPTIFEGHRGASEYILLMEDLRGIDLEQRSSTSHFLDAARKLADIRASSDRIGEISASVLQKHLLTKDQLLLDFDYVLENACSAHREMVNVLRETAMSVSSHVDRLYQELPLTVNHNDYHCKNLIDVGERIVPVDWANARVSPHAGDLFCLIEEAKDHHVPRAAVVGAYRNALQDLGVQADVTDWHIDMGSLCWSVHGLQWILEFGLNAIPVSREWVPDFLMDICTTASRLGRS